MFDIGGGELILIILAVIVLFGPKKLPEIMKTVANGIRKFKTAQSELNEQFNAVKREVDEEINDIDTDKREENHSEVVTNDSEIAGQIKNKFGTYKPIDTKLVDKNERKECN